MKINRSLRDGAHKFRPGDEAKLAAHVTPEVGARLLATGAIEGKGWTFTGSEQPAQEAAQSTPDATANAEITKLKKK